MNSAKSDTWTKEDIERAKIGNRGFSTTKYVRGSILGSGGWSVVYKTQRVTDGMLFAGKSSEVMKELNKEVEMLKSLQHDHIIKFIELHQDPGNPASTLLLTELCPHGTLQSRIDHASLHMARSEILCATLQIAQALEYMHAQRLYHSDVKPRNILIRALSPMHVVLADCADVKKIGQRYKLQGTPAYWSPEMKAQKMHCGCGDDLWALGITVLGMVGQWPQMRYTKLELEMYPGRCFEHVRKLGEMNPGLGIVGLLKGLLAWEVEERITARECVGVVRELDEVGGAEDEFGIKSPEEFRPISFW